MESLSTAVKNWWLILLLGILELILSIWCFITPLSSFLSLSFVFAFFILLYGIFQIIFSLSNTKSLRGWGWFLAGGVLTTVLGILILREPALTAILFTLYIAFWLMFSGVSAIAVAIDLNNLKVPGWFWLLILGIIILILAFIMIFIPAAGAISVVVILALTLLAAGIYNISLSLQMRKLHKKLGGH